MIDLHSHIIFHVDDGAHTIEESINMVKEAKEAGFSDILLTPHYLENHYEVTSKEIEDKLIMIQNELDAQNVGVKLHIGREIYITPDISKKIISGEVSTLNNSKYVLVEIPMETRILYLENELSILIEHGFIPVLAHPERYRLVQRDIEYLNSLAKMGVLFQINYGSILGKYGVSAKNTVKKMLEKGMVDFVGSDCHREGSLYNEVNKAVDKIRKIISIEKLIEITELNAEKIISSK